MKRKSTTDILYRERLETDSTRRTRDYNRVMNAVTPLELMDLPDEIMLFISSHLPRAAIYNRVNFNSVNKYVRNKLQSDIMGDPPSGFATWPVYIEWITSRRTEAVKPVAAARDNQPVMFVTTDGDLISGIHHERYGYTEHGSEHKHHGRYMKLLEGIRIRGISTSDFADMSVAVSYEGHVYTWGMCRSNGNFGQCGRGDHADTAVPMMVQSLSMHRILSVAVGSDHTLAVAETGEVFSWGMNRFGQCGHPIITDTDNTFLLPVQIQSFAGTRARNASAGDSVSAIVTEDGHLFAFGQFLIDGTQLPIKITFPNGVRIKSAAVGEPNSLALIEDGSVFCWDGDRSTPEQIMFPGNAHVREVHIDSRFFGSVTENGKLYMWGHLSCDSKNIFVQSPEQIHGVYNVTAISLKQEQTIVRTHNGTVIELIPYLYEGLRFRYSVLHKESTPHSHYI